jgi:hypothetical protein
MISQKGQVFPFYGPIRPRNLSKVLHFALIYSTKTVWDKHEKL